MIKIRQALGSEALEKINQKLVEIAIEKKIARGRKMRVDTTAVETDVHYPTDSSLLEDGIRAITRKVETINKKLGKHGLKVRNRLRSAKRRAIEIARSARARGEQFKEKKEKSYRKLLKTTKQVIRDAKKVVEHAEQKMKTRAVSAKQAAVARLVDGLKDITGLTERVVRQTKARIVDGDTHYEGKIVSIFQPETELIRRGKASKPNEFGKMVKIQEAEKQIITSYEVYDKKPADSALLVPSIEEHKETFGRAPDLAAADAGFYSAEGVSKAAEAGVSKVCVPNKKTGSKLTREKQKEPWFRRGQRWRVGCEGRISVLKRRHGMSRSRYKGTEGLRCWVGLAVICDNLTNMARALTADG
jgi:IS5 family transposase